MNPLCLSFDTDSCLVKMGYRSLNNLLFDSVHQWRYKSCAFFQLVDYRSRRKRNVEHPSDCLVKIIRTHSIHAQVYKKGAEILSVLYIGINAFRKFSPVHSTQPFFMTVGMTDESCGFVFGYCDGQPTNAHQEGSEDIQVVLADRAECRRILREELVAMPCALVLMQFINCESDLLASYAG